MKGEDGMIPTEQERDMVVQMARLTAAVETLKDTQASQAQASRSAIESVQVDVRRISEAMPALTVLTDMVNRTDETVKGMLVSTAETRSLLDRIKGIGAAVVLLAGAIFGLVYDGVRSAQSRETAERQRLEQRVESIDDRTRGLENHAAGDPARPLRR